MLHSSQVISSLKNQIIQMDSNINLYFSEINNLFIIQQNILCPLRILMYIFFIETAMGTNVNAQVGEQSEYVKSVYQ